MDGTLDDNLANPESLATLSAMVNQTLIETGRFFRSSGSMQSRTQLKRSIPSTHEQFQCALDSLSEQIFIAKAFLEQDLEAAKEKRATPVASENPVPLEKPVVPEDVAMQDATVPNPPAPSKPAETLPLDQPNTQPNTQPTQTHIQQPNAEEPNAHDSGNQIAPEIKKLDSPIHVDDGAPGASNANPPAMNLDSMFPSSTGDGNGSLDLAMGFTNDEAGNQNFLAANNLFGTGDNQNKNQDSMRSLLPGLENYANAAGELNMNPQNSNDAMQQTPTQKDAMNNNIPPGESNFDDLFMDAGNFGGNGEGEDLLNEDALVEIGDLDDSWLD